MQGKHNSDCAILNSERVFKDHLIWLLHDIAEKNEAKKVKWLAKVTELDC